MSLEHFLERMKSYLNESDFEQFCVSFETPAKKCIRINPLRISTNDFMEISPFELEDTTISNLHYRVLNDISGNHPYHLAGLFYMQEASAGSAVEALHVTSGDFVLDLCAAPGGKSTQISGYLNQTGLLVSNEYVSNRAQILLSNTERMGARNVIVTNEHPEKLCTYFNEFFTKILVDAPCSGEGMFRRDDEAIAHWSDEHVQSCAIRQKEILSSAYKALAPGGEMVYSTCTFSLDENEWVIRNFLSHHLDMELIDCDVSFGRPGLECEGIDSSKVIRIYPMDGGDGHFVARMRKKGELQYKNITSKAKSLPKEIEEFLVDQLECNFYKNNKNNFYMVNDDVYYFPYGEINMKGIHVVRCGVMVGSLVKKHFKPHHHFYLAFADVLNKKIDLDLEDSRVKQYLHGDEITCNDVIWNGYGAVCVNGFVLGFIKKSNCQCKNHYPKGLRLN